VAARDGFVAAGDGDRAARVEVLLGLHALARGRAAAADAHVTRALDHLGPDGPPTRTAAMALNTRAFLLLARGQDAAGFAAADRALATARALGQPDLVAGALCPIGASRLMLGDLGGADDLERGIAMLEAARKLQDAAQWWGVLAIGLWTAGLLDRCAAVVAEGRARTTGWGLTPMLSRFGVVTASLDWAAGRWDAVLAFADEFFERFTACDTQRMVEPRVRLARAAVLLARGDVDGALADSTAMVDLVGGADVPVLPQQALAVHGRALLAAGDRDGAADALARVVDGQRRRPATAVVMPNQVLLADDLADDLAEDFRGGLGRALPEGGLDAFQPSPWRDAAAAYLAGDRRQAAALYERMGVPAAAAEARLRAARRLRAAGEVDAAAVELRAATAFLRAAGVAVGVREAEEGDEPDAGRRAGADAGAAANQAL